MISTLSAPTSLLIASSAGAGDLFGLLDARAGRCAETQRELSGVDDRKDLSADLATDDPDDADGDDEIHRRDHPPQSDSGGGETRVPRSRLGPPVSSALACVFVFADRNIQIASTGTSVLESRYDATIANPTASDSGTNKLRAAPCMKNDGMKTARMHSIASRSGHGGFGGRVERGARERFAARQVRVDVLDGDGRLVDEDADGQRQPAERHDVDRLPGDPQREQGRGDGERDVEHDDDGAAPVAQEQQHHQPRQHRAERPFRRQPADGAGDVRRLIELVADLARPAGAPTGTSPRFSFTSSTTLSVEASARLVTGM